jgi:serine/threonine protein kinase
MPCPDARYRVYRFTDSQDVYLYEEAHGATRLVGKFFKSSIPDHARGKGETEYNNLLFLRELGLRFFPHYVVRPYGFNPSIDNVLVLEYLEGDSLGAVIDIAIHRGKGDRLFHKLTALAHFLAVLHQLTSGECNVNFDESHQYMGRLLKSLTERRNLGSEVIEKLHALGDTWRQRSCMWEDRAVLVHGDATPSNFLFGRGGNVMAIDLERMQWADRVFDLGRLCGELKHLFFRSTGSLSAAEPFIGHFLWEYCRHFSNRENVFVSITRRVPFYMGITLLRIARNSWIDWEYRGRLIGEAMNILKVRP